MNELVGTFDRKRRLAREVAAARGWDPLTISAWLIVTSSRTNRRRVEAHRAMLEGALPDDGRAVGRWLRDPVGAVNGLSFWTDMRGAGSSHDPAPIRRVRVASGGNAERGSRAPDR
jgi:hypothetical protein